MGNGLFRGIRIKEEGLICLSDLLLLRQGLHLMAESCPDFGGSRQETTGKSGFCPYSLSIETGFKSKE